MEDSQIEHINKHLKKLLKVTNCTSKLLEELQTTKILKKKDIKSLEKEKLENGDKAEKAMLYSMLQARPDGYESLLASLRKSNCNQAAVGILEDGITPQQTSILLNPEKIKAKIPPKHPCTNKAFTYLSKVWLTALVSGLISAFILVYLVNYLNLSFWLAVPLAAVALPLIFAVQLIPFARATLLLTTPELTSRTLRILLVQTLIALMPLNGLQTSSNTFVDSMVCTNQKAIEAATNGSADLLHNSMNGVKSSIQAINRISDQIQKVLGGPLVAFQKIVAPFENVLKGVEGLKSTCNQGVNGIKEACGGILGVTSTVCDNTLGSIRLRRNIFDNIFKPIQGAVNTVGGAVNHAVNQGVSAVNQGVGAVNQGVGAVQNGINQVASVCSKTKEISTNCQKVHQVGACNGFDKVEQFRRDVDDWKQGAVKTALGEFEFELKTDSGVNGSIDDESVANMTQSVNEKLKEKLDFFQAFKSIWGTILSLSVFFIVISKALLVRKYLKTGKIKVKAISIFFVLMNPFVLQMCFLLLIGVMHTSFYMLHSIFRGATLGNEISLSTNFNASVKVEGGPIGKKIADLIIKSFELQKTVETKLSFDECFQEEVNPPNYLEYMIVVGISLIGILTYAVDVYSRKRHVSLISSVYPSKSFEKKKTQPV